MTTLQKVVLSGDHRNSLSMVCVAEQAVSELFQVVRRAPAPLWSAPFGEGNTEAVPDPQCQRHLEKSRRFSQVLALIRQCFLRRVRKAIAPP